MKKTHYTPAPIDPPEVVLQLPCLACGCHAAFAAIARAGARSNSFPIRLATVVSGCLPLAAKIPLSKGPHLMYPLYPCLDQPFEKETDRDES